MEIFHRRSCPSTTSTIIGRIAIWKTVRTMNRTRLGPWILAAPWFLAKSQLVQLRKRLRMPTWKPQSQKRSITPDYSIQCLLTVSSQEKAALIPAKPGHKNQCLGRIIVKPDVAFKTWDLQILSCTYHNSFAIWEIDYVLLFFGYIPETCHSPHSDLRAL